MLINSASGQVVSGRITSINKDALPGVIVIADDSIGIVTDTIGNYSIQLSSGKHTLEFRFISFKPERRIFYLNENESKTFDITLTESIQELGIVVISAGKFEQKLVKCF